MPRYDVSPTAKVRQTQRDKWKKRPVVIRYRAFADECRRLKIELKDHQTVVFKIEMPASWSERKKREHDGQPHRSRPDLDNLLGGLMDAVMPDGDSQLYSLGLIRKEWARKPGIEITSPYAQPLPYVSACPAEPRSEPPSP